MLGTLKSAGMRGCVVSSHASMGQNEGYVYNTEEGKAGDECGNMVIGERRLGVSGC